VSVPAIAGLRSKPITSVDGSEYTGRLTIYDVQWTVRKRVFVTCRISARQLLDAAEVDMLWTDQDVQRGVKPEKESGHPARELSLKSGFPDPSVYIFETDKANSIAEQLLAGTAEYLDPLIWSMRPGGFDAYADDSLRRMFVYSGKIYLPDSHHRHQGILKAARLYMENSADYPAFDPDQQFNVEVWFLSKEQEGDYFYAKNQLGKPTAKSKAFSLTTTDALSRAARRVTEHAPSLIGNVNKVTDRLAASNTQVITLSTLREMVKTVAGIRDEMKDGLADDETEPLALFIAERYEDLVEVRPELGSLPLVERKKVRGESLVDSGTMMHGYAGLMRQEWVLRQKGHDPAKRFLDWIEPLSGELLYKDGDDEEAWEGNFVRHEALCNRAGVEDLRRCAVAAA